jgi:soluble lytic murein transglycosylase-like protein
MHPTPALALDLRSGDRRFRWHHVPKAAAATIACCYLVVWLSAVALAQGLTPQRAASIPPVTVAAASAAAPATHAPAGAAAAPGAPVSTPSAPDAVVVAVPAHPAVASTVPAPVADPPIMTAKPSTPSTASDYAFLDCVRYRESRGNYRALNPSGAAGAYQLMPGTAREVALRAGRTDLATAPVITWSPADQDLMALVLYHWHGASPWGGSC